MSAMIGDARGFTLLEMVVAIGMFAIIAAISYGALNGFLDARVHINDRRDEFNALQRTFALMERDMRHAVNRTVRDQFGELEPAFFGGSGEPLASNELLRLTTAQPAAGSAGVQQLRRVAWRVAGGELSRVTWQVLDRDIDSPELEHVLIDQVEDIVLSYMSFDEEDELTTDNDWLEEAALPVGVEVVLRLEDQGELRRVFEVAGAQ